MPQIILEGLEDIKTLEVKGNALSTPIRKQS